MTELVNNNVANQSPMWQSSFQKNISGQDLPVLRDSTFKATEAAASTAKQQLHFKQGATYSPLENAVSVASYEGDVANQLLTYNAAGRLESANQSNYGAKKSANSLPDDRLNLNTRHGDDIDNESTPEKNVKRQNIKQDQQQEQAEIHSLAARDREVRSHELAHAAGGGALAGAPSYEFERGPDGVSYAVGGEVSISVGKGRTPEETIANAQMVRRAALAPAEPSPQDRSVAQQATQLEMQARQELAAEQRQKDELLNR